MSSVHAQARKDLLVEAAFQPATLLAALAVLLVLGGIIAGLVHGAWPALIRFKWHFLTTATWNPVTEVFGAMAPLYGTIVTSAIAMFLAVPIAIGIAIFLTETCPRQLRAPVGTAIELLAAIPSIVYGIWGLFVLAPILQHHVQPWLILHLGKSQFVGVFFAGPPFGIGIFTAGLVLAIMVLPYIAAVTRDVFLAVPRALKEAAYGMGATRWEVIRDVVIPYASGGTLGAIMIGLGRALGETMAVTFVIGNAYRISASLMAPATTISAAIANEFTEAVGDLYTSSLIALGLLLFVITFTVIALARLILIRLERRSGRHP